MMNPIWTALLKPRAWIAKLVLILAAAGFLSLGYLDYLQPITAVLDSEEFSFSIGETRFSTYLLIKGLILVIVLFWLAGIFAEFGEKRIKNIKNIRKL